MLVINVRGVCNESVSIRRDDVTLSGDASLGGTVKPPGAATDAIPVTGTRIVISGLTVTGGRNGIVANGVAAITIADSVIQQAAQHGVSLFNSSGRIFNNTIEYSGANGIWLSPAGAYMVNNTVQCSVNHGIWNSASNLQASRNTIQFNAGTGLVVTDHSYINATRNTITTNGSSGVGVLHGPTATFYQNTITDNGQGSEEPGAGVQVQASTASVSSDNISNNAASGMVGWGGSSVTVSGVTTISNNGWTGIGSGGGSLGLGNTVIRGNSGGGYASTARWRA